MSLSQSDETVQIRSDFSLKFVDFMGDDQAICEAARVSTEGANSYGSGESEGLINFLMRNRHGSPFEHASMKFVITAPIFVWREFMRHRIGFSYNEQSGRYMEMKPVFYMPPRERPLAQIGKTGNYEFVPGTRTQYDLVRTEFISAAYYEWARYKRLLDAGVAKEVARMYLPLALYSTAYVTCNPRSLMSFLSLRTKHPDAKYPSYPMYEIEQVACSKLEEQAKNSMEPYFSAKFPLTYAAFCEHGRVAP